MHNLTASVVKTKNDCRSCARATEALRVTPAVLVTVFVAAATAGLLIEDAYHVIVYGGYESRAGLIWGPFSPIYGFGAVALTLVGNRMCGCRPPTVFVASALVGSSVEFVTSWLMQHFFGAVAWDYSGTFGNIQGRVNLKYAFMWGILGILWVYLVLPGIGRLTDRPIWRSLAMKTATAALVGFLVIDAIVTIQVLDRAAERAEGQPAVTKFDRAIDAAFPQSWVEHRFHNMTIYGQEQE